MAESRRTRLDHTTVTADEVRAALGVRLVDMLDAAIEDAAANIPRSLVAGVHVAFHVSEHQMRNAILAERQRIAFGVRPGPDTRRMLVRTIRNEANRAALDLVGLIDAQPLRRGEQLRAVLTIETDPFVKLAIEEEAARATAAQAEAQDDRPVQGEG
jgi:hypothetical protein